MDDTLTDLKKVKKQETKISRTDTERERQAFVANISKCLTLLLKLFTTCKKKPKRKSTIEKLKQ